MRFYILSFIVLFATISINAQKTSKKEWADALYQMRLDKLSIQKDLEFMAHVGDQFKAIVAKYPEKRNKF